MKKVRFESPVKAFKIKTMQEPECHSPRPFIEKQVSVTPSLPLLDFKQVPYTNEPVQNYECSNSLPFPKVSKTHLLNNNRLAPSDDLELSTLDCTHYGASTVRSQDICAHTGHINFLQSSCKTQLVRSNFPKKTIMHLDNTVQKSPNILNRNEDFFFTRDNVKDLNKVQDKMSTLQLDKENHPSLKKKEMMNFGHHYTSVKFPNPNSNIVKCCKCHHCIENVNSKQCMQSFNNNRVLSPYQNHFNNSPQVPNTSYPVCWPSDYKPVSKCTPNSTCNNQVCQSGSAVGRSPKNALDKKSWAIEKYEMEQKTECLDVELQNTLSKEKREPTVADLFKIIKLQNEQLQLLQEKVDKFISSTIKQDTQNIAQPIQNYVKEHVAVASIGTEQKISVGVMTSFEMVRTSTIINKEIFKQNEAQIQCNRSQISIKEVVSKSQPNNSSKKFLEGIAPVQKTQSVSENTNNVQEHDHTTKVDNGLEDKTFNEMSLYNVQVDNAITPLMSPEPSLYLEDVRDYSDSDASSDDHSNVGWTYYNKVMTHVNGILQESDMPSSASALYRKARKQCMQTDRTNFSVSKRVTFGNDPVSDQQVQAQIHVPTTDTSLKMNQLAAKYLKKGALLCKTAPPKSSAILTDMSVATRNYMEKHNIIQQGPNSHRQQSSPQIELPRFLDITALKQQPKLL